MHDAMLTLIAAVVGAITAASLAQLYRIKLIHEEEKRRDSEAEAFLGGIPAIPGVTNGALSAALRMVKVEQGLSGVVQGQSLLEKRMDEANGTGKRTEQMVREIRTHLGLTTS